MKQPAAFLLGALLCVSGASPLLAGDAPPSESGTTAGETQPADDAGSSAATPQDDATGPAAAATESGDKAAPGVNVNRHRPGACPEGPPCKKDD